MKSLVEDLTVLTAMPHRPLLAPQSYDAVSLDQRSICRETPKIRSHCAALPDPQYIASASRLAPSGQTSY